MKISALQTRTRRGDITNIWLFELGNYYGANNPIRFGGNARTTKDLQKQEGVLEARQKAIAAAQQGKPSESHGWKYGQKEFYDGINQGNVATSFLGSYTTVVDIAYNGDGTVTLNYSVSNVSGWESGTRLRKDHDNNGNHDAIIPNKQRGTGINLGGNVKQVWTWSEVVPISK